MLDWSQQCMLPSNLLVKQTLFRTCARGYVAKHVVITSFAFCTFSILRTNNKIVVDLQGRASQPQIPAVAEIMR